MRLSDLREYDERDLELPSGPLADDDEFSTLDPQYVKLMTSRDIHPAWPNIQQMRHGQEYSFNSGFLGSVNRQHNITVTAQRISDGKSDARVIITVKYMGEYTQQRTFVDEAVAPVFATAFVANEITGMLEAFDEATRET